MKRFALTIAILALRAACFGQAPPAAGGTSPGAAGPAAGGAAGGFSIEAEILAYKALESDSEAIACEVAGLLSTSEGTQFKDPATFKPPCNLSRRYGDHGPGVLIVSSATTVLANYQLWRVNMVIVSELLEQAKGVCQAKAEKPKKAQPEKPELFGAFIPALGADATSLAPVITLIQSTLQLFASNESVTGVTGTIQDQALMNDVARQLRYLNFPVLMPDTYYPHNFGGIDYANSPFLAKFAALIKERVRLGTCVLDLMNSILKISKEQADLADRLKQAQSEQTTARQASVKAQKTAKAAEDALKNAPADTTKQKASDAAAAAARAAQNDVDTADANVSAIQARQQELDSALKKANLELNRAQSVVASIDGFIATVTGGTPPVPASGSPQTTAAAAPGAAAPGTTTPGATTPGATPTPGTTPGGQTPTAASSTPPIVAILWADGLAREIGVKADGTWNDTSEPRWSVLALKALESGGSLINEANIFGTRVRFSGGAVATYSLFGLEQGRLFCSGDFFDYGGYIRAKDFAKKFTENINPGRQLVYMRPGPCPGTAPR